MLMWTLFNWEVAMFIILPPVARTAGINLPTFTIDFKRIKTK